MWRLPGGTFETTRQDGQKAWPTAQRPAALGVFAAVRDCSRPNFRYLRSTLSSSLSPFRPAGSSLGAAACLLRSKSCGID